MNPSEADRRRLLRLVDRRLETVHGSPRHGNLRQPTSELIYLLLTVKTRIVEVRPHYLRLRRLCGGSWNALPDLRPDDLRPALEPLGLWRKRGEQLVAIAKRLREDFGRVTLAPLSRRPAAEAIAYLDTLPGVGEKLARCVALYALDADVSPMDSNATRVLARIGVLPRGTTPARAHALIDTLVEPGASYRLHVNLVAHGGSLCLPRNPLCARCPVAPDCRYARTGR